MHTLRHSFASEAADLGYSDSTIGALMGHKGDTTTSRYIHLLQVRTPQTYPASRNARHGIA
jgi:integrase